jgi:hypothetical protein
MRRVLFACLLSWLLTGAARAACGPDPLPAPAAAHGFNCEVFWDNFDSLSTIDLGNGLASGFKWYVTVAYGGVTDASVFAQTSGGLQITPDVNGSHPNSSSLYQLSSCAPTATTGVWVGNTVTGSMYIDIKLTTWGPQLGGNNWWPAAWTLGANQIAGNMPATGNSPEIDLREWAGTEPRYIHYWPPTGADLGGGSYVSSTPAFVSGDTYGALLLDPSINGGTGTVIGYLDDLLETNSTPISWTAGGLYSNSTLLPMCILFTSGYNQAVVIRSVGVWQTGPPPTGGRGIRGRR